MKLTAQISYALDALLDIAERYEERSAVNLHEISERHDIPEKYLLQVMVKLKQEGLVRSRRGSGGGFRLAMSPENISLADVVKILGKSNLYKGNGDSPQPLGKIWNQANKAFMNELRGHTLDSLVHARQSDIADM